MSDWSEGAIQQDQYGNGFINGIPVNVYYGNTGNAAGSPPITNPSAAPDPNALEGQDSGAPSGGGGQDSNPFNQNIPSLDQLQPGQGMFTSSSGGSGSFGGYDQSSGGGWNPGSDLPTGTYQNGYTPGGTGGGGGGGGGYPGSIGMAGNTGQVYGGGVPSSPYAGNTPSGSTGSRQGGGLGSTTQLPSNTGVTGGGFDPNSPRNPFNQAQPWNGGPQTMMGQTGFNANANTSGASPYMTMSGFKAGGIGGPATTAYNQYQNMVANPADMTANPAYKAIMDASLQATQRAQLARGGNGGGTLAAELAKTGASVAGQYIPQMANMYQGAAQQELGNWTAQNQANLGAGALGSNLYGQANQANLGYGNLANNMWTNAANNQFNIANAYGQMQNGAANTQGAALAQAQMNPANNYFQNQLTLGGWG